MAEISALAVKELRNKTGAGMADCKNALVESNGDMEKAIEILRKKGAASIAKRADRETNEGMVIAITSADGKSAAIVEVTCETDFVARNADFMGFVNNLGNAYMNGNVETKEEILALKVGNDTVEQLYNDILAKFSEKIDIGRFAKIKTNGYVAAYIHGGSKLGVLVEVSENVESDSHKTIVKDIAMQVAAMNPLFLDRSKVDQATLDKEKEIYMQQAVQEGKNPDIAEKIASGRVEKFYKEQCLVEQMFIKDSTKNINEVVKQISPTISINNFVRIAIG